MRRVHFSRAERDDSLVSARDAIHHAIFEREAARLGLEVVNLDGEDNYILAYVDCPAPLALTEFLQNLDKCGMPTLAVKVPCDELDTWLAHDLSRSFFFETILGEV